MKTLIKSGHLYLDNLKRTELHSFSQALEKDRQESLNTVD